MSNFLDIFNKQYFPPPKEESYVLRKSQTELLKQLAKGLTIKQTAALMNLKYYNLQKRTQLLYKKFGVNNRYNLIVKALEHNLIAYSDVSPKCRKRFFKHMPAEELPPPETPKYELSQDEITLLKLSAEGATRKEITEKMNLCNLNVANCIAARACFNLRARNIAHAVSIAIDLNLI